MSNQTKMLIELVVFACVLGVNSSHKDIIRISIDNNKPQYSKEQNKNIRIEISKDKNQSHENIITGDRYDRFNLGNRNKIISHKYPTKNTHEENNWHGHGKILSSIEETDNLWEETHKDNSVMNSEPNTDNIFVDSIHTNTFTNTRKIPPVYARKYTNRELKREISIQSKSKLDKESNSDETREENSKENGKDGDSSDNEETGCKFANGFADNAKAPCSSNASNLKYQARTDAEESNEHDPEVDYSYSVSVQRKGSHYTSGALVGERWVLSSAAEFYNVRETIKLFRIRMGSADCKKGGHLTPIQSITLHPRFTPGSPGFDVSILRAAEPVVTSYPTQPIAISKVVTGKVVTGKFLATYWPRIVVKDAVLPQSASERVKYSNMRVSTQKLVPFEECRRKLAAAHVRLDQNSLCLTPVKAHHSACMPDPGAPIVATDGLWGITSGWVSPTCPSTTLPTVFTRVATADVRNWIYDQINL